MSKDLNQCNFIGRLGRDPEHTVTKTGLDISKFSIACGDDYKDKQGNKVEQTNWINVVAMGGLAKVCNEWLKKGSQIFVSGKQVTKKWQAQDGTDRYTTEILANDLQMLGGKSESGGFGSTQKPQAKQEASNFDDFDSEVPF